MHPWIRLLGLFAAIVVAALLLQVLPPLVVLALFVGGVGYANHALTRASKAQSAAASAQIMGLEIDRGSLPISAYPFALLERGKEQQVTDVVSGQRQGVELRMFDLSYAPATHVEGLEAMGVRREFTCAITTVPLEGPHTIVEPRTFLTSESEGSGLPAVEVGSAPVRSAFDVRSNDAGFVEGLLDPDVSGWLLGQDGRWALEIRGRALLWYAQRLAPDDRFQLLEAVTTFLGLIPAPVRERFPAVPDPQIPDPPVDVDPDP